MKGATLRAFVLMCAFAAFVYWHRRRRTAQRVVVTPYTVPRVDSGWTELIALHERTARGRATGVFAAFAGDLAAAYRYAAERPALFRKVFGKAPLALAGGANAVTAGGRYPTIPRESLSALRPEAVLDLTGHAEGGPLAEELAGVDAPALRDGRVTAFADPMFLRPGPRVAEAARQIAAALHPEGAPGFASPAATRDD